MTVFHRNILEAVVSSLRNIYHNVKLTVESDETSESLKQFILRHMETLDEISLFIYSFSDKFLDLESQSDRQTRSPSEGQGKA